MSSFPLDCGSTPSAKKPRIFAESEGFPVDPGDADVPGDAGAAGDEDAAGDVDAPGVEDAPGAEDVPDDAGADPPLQATSVAAITMTINNAIAFFIFTLLFLLTFCLFLAFRQLRKTTFMPCADVTTILSMTRFIVSVFLL